jgi:hypothetical protein
MNEARAVNFLDTIVAVDRDVSDIMMHHWVAMLSRGVPISDLAAMRGSAPLLLVVQSEHLAFEAEGWQDLLNGVNGSGAVVEESAPREPVVAMEEDDHLSASAASASTPSPVLVRPRPRATLFRSLLGQRGDSETDDDVLQRATHLERFRYPLVAAHCDPVVQTRHGRRWTSASSHSPSLLPFDLSSRAAVVHGVIVLTLPTALRVVLAPVVVPDRLVVDLARLLDRPYSYEERAVAMLDLNVVSGSCHRGALEHARSFGQVGDINLSVDMQLEQLAAGNTDTWLQVVPYVPRVGHMLYISPPSSLPHPLDTRAFAACPLNLLHLHHGTQASELDAEVLHHFAPSFVPMGRHSYRGWSYTAFHAPTLLHVLSGTVTVFSLEPSDRFLQLVDDFVRDYLDLPLVTGGLEGLSRPLMLAGRVFIPPCHLRAAGIAVQEHTVSAGEVVILPGTSVTALICSGGLTALVSAPYLPEEWVLTGVPLVLAHLQYMVAGSHVGVADAMLQSVLTPDQRAAVDSARLPDDRLMALFPLRVLCRLLMTVRKSLAQYLLDGPVQSATYAVLHSRVLRAPRFPLPLPASAAVKRLFSELTALYLSRHPVYIPSAPWPCFPWTYTFPDLLVSYHQIASCLELVHSCGIVERCGVGACCAHFVGLSDSHDACRNAEQALQAYRQDPLAELTPGSALAVYESGPADDAYVRNVLEVWRRGVHFRPSM